MTSSPASAVGSSNGSVDAALALVARLANRFGTLFPADVTTDGHYPPRPARHGEPEGGNTDWTTGFVPGMYWVASELSGNQSFLDAARSHVPGFVRRIDQRIDVDHHDLGFLYTLSCAPAWRHDGDRTARSATIAAADHLLGRYHEKAGVIQAWGDLTDPLEQGRAIIDSLMNMPLLHWASRETGDPRYADAARRHAHQLRAQMIRPDDTTFHTFVWDPATGDPMAGSTNQGFADDSAWARGQAWGIYGFALNAQLTGDDELLDAAVRCARLFISRLPADGVPYWDLVFGEGSEEERDSSAGSIAVCGLLEVARLTGDPEFESVARHILDSLTRSYATRPDSGLDCLLQHGVYDKNRGKGVDEGNLWGDYFYLEALLRVERPDWVPYWLPAPTTTDGRVEA